MLIPKVSRSKNIAELPASHRPLCLLDEIRKLLERVIASRLEAIIGAKGGLSRKQFGVRLGLSTCDAIIGVREIVDEHLKHGRICVAVSLDIQNAFNSIK